MEVETTIMETLERIGKIIDEADKMRGAFFYNPPLTAGERRAYERKHSHNMVEWTDEGHTYTAEYNVSCSCHNVYAYGVYTKDGNKTNLKAIKSSYKRLTDRRN